MRDGRSKELAPSEKAAPQFQGIGAISKNLPRSLRKEIAAFARKLKRDHSAMFTSNPAYRKRAGQFLTALLPPRPKRRGRPGIQSVTTAIRLRGQFSRQHPNERPEIIWRRIYPQAIAAYATMTDMEQADARQQLRERVRWRLRDRKRRSRRRGESSRKSPSLQSS
jgi:hypothetical protein